MARPLLFARSLVFAVLIVIATVVWAIGCFGFLLLPYRQRYWMIIRWNVFISYAAKYVCGIRWQIKGFGIFRMRRLFCYPSTSRRGKPFSIAG